MQEKLSQYLFDKENRKNNLKHILVELRFNKDIIDRTWKELSEWRVRDNRNRPKFGFQKFNFSGHSTILRTDFLDIIPESMVSSLLNIYNEFDDMNQLIEYYKQGDEVILSPLNQDDSPTGTFIPATMEYRFHKMNVEIDKLIQFLESDFVNLN